MSSALRSPSLRRRRPRSLRPRTQIASLVTVLVLAASWLVAGAPASADANRQLDDRLASIASRVRVALPVAAGLALVAAPLSAAQSATFLSRSGPAPMPAWASAESAWM